MTKYPWFRRVCELEDQGRFEEADAYFMANTTPEERAAVARAKEALVKAVAKISPESWAESEEIMKRFRALKHLPEDNPKRMIWENFWRETPASMSRLKWRRNLPDPLKMRGRPKGRGVVAEDAELFAEIDRLAARPEDVPTVVRSLVPEDHPWRKSRVDHIVKEYRKRGKR